MEKENRIISYSNHICVGVLLKMEYTVSELITELEKIRQTHGDIKVRLVDDDSEDGGYRPFFNISVVRTGLLDWVKILFSDSTLSDEENEQSYSWNDIYFSL